MRKLQTLTAVLLAAAAGCSRDQPVATAAAPPQGPAAVDVVAVVERPLDVDLELPGELTAYQSVAIYPRVSGFVRSVRVDRGSHVQAGDLIATIEAPELVAQRAEAQSRLQAAQAELAAAQARADAGASTFDRLKAASATPGVVAGNDVVLAEKAAAASNNQVAASRENVEAARQALNAVREMEGFLRVTAPFAGVITERSIHPGALVGPAGGSGASAIVTLVEQDRLRLIVPVPEAYSARIQTGTKVPFTVAAYPGETWTGTVARTAQAVDVHTRTMAVELDVANPAGRLAPGSFCQVRWPVRRTQPSLFVPSTSVAATSDRTFVIRIRSGKAEWVDVKTGITSGQLVEVFGDLHPGDQVARRGTDELRPGTDVRPRNL